MWKLLQRQPNTQRTFPIKDGVSKSEVVAAFQTLGELVGYVDKHPNLNKVPLLIQSPGGLAIKFPFDGH